MSIDTVPETNSPTASITTRNSTATLYGQFNANFCIYDRSAPDPWGGVKFKSSPPIGRGVIVETGNTSFNVTPIRNPNGAVEFVIYDNGERYILSNSKNEYLLTKKLQSDIPKRYALLYNIASQLKESRYDVAGMQTNLDNIGQVTTVNGKTKITLTNEAAVSIPPDINLYTACAFEKAETVLLYINNIGFSTPDANSTYYYIIEQALNECGWACKSCTDATCTFPYIFGELNGDNFSDINKLNSSFLKYAMQLNEGQIEGISGIFSQEIAASIYYLYEDEDIRTDKECFTDFTKDLIDDVVASPNFLNNISNVQLQGNLRFSAQRPMCSAFLDFSLNPENTVQSENIGNLLTKFVNPAVPSQMFTVPTRNMFFMIGNSILSSGCSAREIVTDILNTARNKNEITFPYNKLSDESIPKKPNIKIYYYAHIKDALCKKMRGTCLPQDSSPIYKFGLYESNTNNTTFMIYQTTTTYFNDQTFSVCQ